MKTSRRIIFTCCVLFAMAMGVRADENEEEETNPFFEAAKSLIQDQLQNNPNAQGFGAVGGMLTSFLASGGGKQLGEMFAGGSKNNPGGDIIAGIGSLVSSMAQNQNGGGGGGGGGGGWDPQLIGSMVSMFANSMTQGDNVDVNNNEVNTGGKKSRKQEAAGGIDLESMLSLASSFMGQNQNGGGGGGGMEGLLNILPVLMQGMGGISKENNAPVNTGRQGKQKTSFLPPFLEHFAEYWQHFRNSEFGETLWRNSGMEGIVNLFTDEKGHFDVDKIFKSLENPSFRRRWIKSLTSFVAEWVSHVADPATQTRYIGTAQFVANSFLKAQGYNKGIMFDPARPAESLSLIVDAVFKKQFGLHVQAGTYIKPAMAYLQDVFKIGQSKGFSLSHLQPGELESKMAETLNGEVIEPILKVWRAYRFANENRKCDKYVICVINQVKDVGVGLKPGVTKLASLGASWFLSGQTNTPFWKLYNAATENHNCDAKYGASDCGNYHEFDVQTTTEYIHNEL